MRAYFDYNATAPLRRVARQAIEECLDLLGLGGNPSSPHWAGRAARRALEEARERIAAIIGAEPLEVVFTSGGTESNNMALCAQQSLPLVTSAIEHSSILRLAARQQGGEGRQVRIVRVDSTGRIDLDELSRCVEGQACLVSLGLANNEVGTIQEVEAVERIVHRHGGRLHLDAVQAAGKIPIDVKSLAADLVSLSAHKVGGPAGVGALYVKKGSGLRCLLWGGAQEGGRRAGTENLLGAVGFAAALEEAEREREREGERLVRLREKLWRGIVRAAPRVTRNSPPAGSLANTLNLSFVGLDGPALAAALDLEGIAVSTGSACAAGAFEPSHVLQAMGRSAEEVRGAIRFSLGQGTTEEDVESALAALGKVLGRMTWQAGASRAEGEAWPPSG